MGNRVDFVYNPSLRFIKPSKGNIKIKGVFQNEEERYHPSWLQMMKWGIASLPQIFSQKNFLRVPQAKSKGNLSEDNQIVWLGHSSFWLKVGGFKLLIDPVLNSLPFHPRFTKFPYEYKAIFEGIDFVLLSHDHRDHLDVPTIKKIMSVSPKAKILTGLGISPILPKRWRTNVEEAAWYQAYRLPLGIEVFYLPALHWGRRYLHDYNKRLWGSFVIKTKDFTIYYGGDSAYGTHFQRIKALFPKIDLCILPIGAYEPNYIMKGAHMTPLEAYEAFRVLGARYFIPCHYGTFDLSDETVCAPLEEIRKVFGIGLKEGLMDLTVGESVLIEEYLERSKKNG